MGAMISLLLWAIGLFILYWVIRAAVKGGILDADRTLARERERSTRAAVKGGVLDADNERP